MKAMMDAKKDDPDASDVPDWLEDCCRICFVSFQACRSLSISPSPHPYFLWCQILAFAKTNSVVATTRTHTHARARIRNPVRAREPAGDKHERYAGTHACFTNAHARTTPYTHAPTQTHTHAGARARALSPSQRKTDKQRNPSKQANKKDRPTIH